MKKVIFAALGILSFATVSMAQEAKAQRASAIKEVKIETKEKQDDDLAATFAVIGLTDEAMKVSKEILAEADKKTAELKANEKMTDEERIVAKKTINAITNEKLKEVMGTDKFNRFNEIRVKQKTSKESKPTE